MSSLTGATVEALNNPSVQDILILGGGFGGVKTALGLANANKYNVTLISDRPDFRYYPMLYQTATGGSQRASTIALSEIFEGKDINVVLDVAKKLDRQKKTVKGASGKSYRFDILIVALGSVTNYFGIKGLKENSFGIKTLEEAKQLRDHIHEQLIDEGKPDINYVVVGGGPTGVELAGSLPKYVKHIMKQHHLRDRKVKVVVVEALPRLMPRMSQRYSDGIASRLKKLGVKIMLNEKVLAETQDKLTMSGESLISRTVIWTAGVSNNPFITNNKFNLDEHGKVEVDEFLAAEEDIYVLGDNARTEYSGMAQTALHDGKFVARNLMLRIAGRSAERYEAKKPVYITPAGSFWAAVSWKGYDFFGVIGWALRKVADLAGYHDLEPWWRASERWLADSDNHCQTCSGQRSQN